MMVSPFLKLRVSGLKQFIIASILLLSMPWNSSTFSIFYTPPSYDSIYLYYNIKVLQTLQEKRKQ